MWREFVEPSADTDGNPKVVCEEHGVVRPGGDDKTAVGKHCDGTGTKCGRCLREIAVR